MCSWIVFLLTSSCWVSATPPIASYGFIYFDDHSASCNHRYSYDFTTAVHLALENLEKNNDTYTHGSGSGEEFPIMLGGEPDITVPFIRELSFQDICEDNNLTEFTRGKVAGNSSTSIVAVLSGECQPDCFGEVDLNNLLRISYSPNVGEVRETFFNNNTIHMFPLQMKPMTVFTLLEVYGWRKAIVLTEEHTQLKEINSIAEALGSFAVSVVTLDNSTLNEPKQVVEHVLEGDYQVIVLNTYTQTAKSLLCEAYHLKKMHYPRYVWILPGWFEESWWKETKDSSINFDNRRACTLEEMKSMLINSLGVMEIPSDYPKDSESNSLFHALYHSAVALKIEENITRQFAPPELAAYAYDSVWLLAAVLSLHNVSTNHKLSADTVLDYLSTKGYSGTSGQISFDKVGRRFSTQAYVTLYREGPNKLLKRVPIGVVDNTNGDNLQFIYINNESASTVWSGDKTPPIRIKIRGILLPLTAIYYTLAALGILFSVFCIGFNLRYRNYKVIRLSSPNLNYITCAGAIVLLLSAFFIGSPSKMTSLFPFLCMGNVWAGAIGASLQYGTIQAKMFRVYIIFRRPGQKNLILKDWHLAIYVAVLVAIDVVLLSVVTAIPEALSVGKLVVDQEHPPFKDASGVTVMSVIHDCESQKEGVDTYWFVLLFGYKLVLQIIVTVLAFLICSTKVEIEALNDHRAVQAITYVNMAILIVTVALAFAVSNYANAKAAVNGLSVLVGAYFNLSLVFLPKMYALYKDPEGRKVFKSAGNSTSIAAGTPEQSTNSSVASRPAVAKEEISDASNSGCSQLIATQHTFGQVDSKGGVVATNGMNQLECHTTGLMSSKPHPLSFTNTATVTSCGCGTDGAGSYLSESPNGCNVLLETIDIAAQNVP